VIVGGGFGGLAAAKVLKGTVARVTLVDRRNHHVFQPLLYQVATAGLSPGDIGAPIRWILRRSSNVRVLLGEARAIDAAARRLMLADGEALDYDCLIVATGVRHDYFGHPEWEAHAPGLKTLEDALEIRRRILMAFERAEREPDAARRQELLTFVLVGGGPTGVELAGTLAEITRQTLRHEFKSIDTAGARIVVVEAGPAILKSFHADLRKAARASLDRLGIEVRERTRVTHIDAHGVEMAGPDGGVERITAATVLWAAGVAASPLVATIGAPLDDAGRAIVEPDLSIPGHPEVFVVGDAAAFLHQPPGTPDGRNAEPPNAERPERPEGPNGLPGVVQPAMQEAAHAARNILRLIRREPTRPFVYRDLGSMAIIGRGSAIADLGWARLSGTIGWLAWLFLHIVMLIGFRSRVVVLVQWAVAYFTFQRSARLIMNRGAPLQPHREQPASEDPTSRIDD
jgi:NADH dehydrogenase